MGIEARDIQSLLEELALEIVEHQDGRKLSELDLGRLEALSEVAERLGLSETAERLGRLSLVAAKGFTRDLAHAWARILLEL